MWPQRAGHIVTDSAVSPFAVSARHVLSAMFRPCDVCKLWSAGKTPLKHPRIDRQKFVNVTGRLPTVRRLWYDVRWRYRCGLRREKWDVSRWPRQTYRAYRPTS